MGQPVNIRTRKPIEDTDPMPHNLSHNGGSGGGDDMLEARVAKLEANVEHIASDTNEIKLNLRVTSSDVAELKTDTALSKRDIADIKFNTSSLKQDFITMNGRVSDLETSINSFKTTIKVSVGVISAAVVVFGIIPLCQDSCHPLLKI